MSSDHGHYFLQEYWVALRQDEYSSYVVEEFADRSIIYWCVGGVPQHEVSLDKVSDNALRDGLTILMKLNKDIWKLLDDANKSVDDKAK